MLFLKETSEILDLWEKAVKSGILTIDKMKQELEAHLDRVECAFTDSALFREYSDMLHEGARLTFKIDLTEDELHALTKDEDRHLKHVKRVIQADEIVNLTIELNMGDDVNDFIDKM